VGHVCVKKKRTARGPELDDQIVIKRRTGELGAVPEFCLGFVEVVKLSLIKLT
jgi:hypothetical protein